MKVVRTDVPACDFKGHNSLSLDVDHAILNLEWPFDAQEPASGDDDAVPLEYIGRSSLGTRIHSSHASLSTGFSPACSLFWEAA